MTNEVNQKSAKNVSQVFMVHVGTGPIHPKLLYNLVKDALNAAEARGMERAAMVAQAWGSAEGQHVAETIRAEVKKLAAT